MPVGDWRDEPGYPPPRVHPRAWPNEKLLAELRRAAVELDDLA